jgi:hypothetical protein
MIFSSGCFVCCEGKAQAFSMPKRRHKMIIRHAVILKILFIIENLIVRDAS